jgi:hypothetical protein
MKGVFDDTKGDERHRLWKTVDSAAVANVAVECGVPHGPSLPALRSAMPIIPVAST